MSKKIAILATVVITAVLISSMSLWFFYRYEATVLSLTYEATPIMLSPLSDSSYSWTAKAYGARLFGNAPFDGKGYVHRARVTSENRFRHVEFQNLNVSLRLRFQVTNGTGYVVGNETLESTDGCDREVTFEFRPEALQAGSSLQLKITLNLNINYSYGAGGEYKQFSLQREWTRTVEVHQTDSSTDVFG